jgi:carbon storage regulator
MLILTRKIGETIRIGDNVTVRVLGLRGGQVSLGFTAPDDVRILREEILSAAPSAGDAAAANRVPDRAALELASEAKRPLESRVPRVATRADGAARSG